MKKICALILAAVMTFCLCACDANVRKGSIIDKSPEGMAELDIMPQKLFEIAALGDSVLVTVGNFKQEIPLVEEVIEQDGTLQLFYASDEHCLYLCAYNRDFCEAYGISPNSKVSIQKP